MSELIRWLNYYGYRLVSPTYYGYSFVSQWTFRVDIKAPTSYFIDTAGNILTA